MKRLQRGVATGWLLLVILLMAVGSAYLYRMYSEERDLRVTAEADLKTANGNTKTCNKSIEGLESKAFARGQAAGLKRAANKAKADKLASDAQQELMTPPTVPGNDCKSAEDRVKRILFSRKKP